MSQAAAEILSAAMPEVDARNDLQDFVAERRVIPVAGPGLLRPSLHIRPYMFLQARTRK